MRRYLALLARMFRHKWYIWRESRRYKLPLWLVLIHDWSKFLPDEFIPNGRIFFNRDGTRIVYPEGRPLHGNFGLLALRHFRRNKHHWQYWILPYGPYKAGVFPMPDLYRREMMADWWAIHRMNGGNDLARWYMDHIRDINLAPETREWVEGNLGIISVWEKNTLIDNRMVKVHPNGEYRLSFGEIEWITGSYS